MNDFVYPEITPHAKCPTCGELVFINIDKYADENGNPIWENIEEKYEKCQNCGIVIEFEREILPSLVDNFTLSSAISSANNLTTVDFSVFFFIGTILIRWLFLSQSLAELEEFAIYLKIIIIGSSLLWFISPLFILRWHSLYGNLNSKEEEYLSLKKSLRMSFALWTAANIFNLLAMYLEGWFS